MSNNQKFYINGECVDPVSSETLDVINPATEESIATIAMGNEEDLNRAVAAARAAFDSWSLTSKEERIALLAPEVLVLQRVGRQVEDRDLVDQEATVEDGGWLTLATMPQRSPSSTSSPQRSVSR